MVYLASFFVILIANLAPAIAGQTKGSTAPYYPMLIKAEGWEAKDIKPSPILLSEDKNRHFVIVHSKSECGLGTCTQYVFEINSKTSYNFLGQIDGMAEVLTEKSKGLFNLRSTAKIGSKKEDQVIQVWIFNGKKYELQ